MRMLTVTKFATFAPSDGAHESRSEVGLSASMESSAARANRREALPERLRLRGSRRFDMSLLRLKSLDRKGVPVRSRLVFHSVFS